MLTLCLSFDLAILNGGVPADELGSYTFVSVHGERVIDYFILSRDAISVATGLEVHGNVLSSHMSVELELKCTTGNVNNRHSLKSVQIPRLIIMLSI